MQSYTYSGKKKLYAKPTEKGQSNNFIFKNVGFILCGAHPFNNTKSNGSKLLHKYKDSEVFEYQLDLINSICENPEIIVTTGIDHKEFVKHQRKSEFVIVENQMYEFSNSAEDLRLGLLALRSPHVIFIDSVIIPTIETMRYLLTGREMSSKIFTKKVNDNYIGAIKGERYIDSYSFSSPDKLTGMYFINTNDIHRILKKTIGKNFSKNKFAFELLEDSHSTIIYDESNSVLIAR